MSTDVEERIKQLEQQLASQKKPKSLVRVKKRLLLGLLVSLSLGMTFYALSYFTREHTITTPATSTQMGFSVYFYEGKIPDGFELEHSSVSTRNNVLVYKLINKKSGKQVIFTEQTTRDFDRSQLQADKELRTQYGQAYITDGQSRTTGTLFTDDGTWVLVNAPSPIGLESMQTLLEELTKSL